MEPGLLNYLSERSGLSTEELKEKFQSVQSETRGECFDENDIVDLSKLKYGRWDHISNCSFCKRVMQYRKADTFG